MYLLLLQLISSCSYFWAPTIFKSSFTSSVWLTTWKLLHSTFVDWLAGGVSWDIKGRQLYKYTSELFHLSRCSGSTFRCTLKKMSNPGHLVLTLNRAEPGPSGLDIGHLLNPGEEGKASKTICSWLCVRHTHFGENMRQTLYIYKKIRWTRTAVDLSSWCLTRTSLTLSEPPSNSHNLLSILSF